MKTYYTLLSEFDIFIIYRALTRLQKNLRNKQDKKCTPLKAETSEKVEILSRIFEQKMKSLKSLDSPKNRRFI